MSLSDWEKNAYLQMHTTSREEVQNLLKIVESDLTDCQVKDVSTDWRFAIAYNAAFQYCTIALYCSGFKPARGQSEHYRIIQSLPLTIGSGFEQMRDYLNICRSKRNVSHYDSIGTISESETRELIETATELHQELGQWLLENHPQYIKSYIN